MSSNHHHHHHHHQQQQHMDQISELVQQCLPIQASELRPKSFFVAWNGIPCLVFEGFPPPCVETKQRLNNNNNTDTTDWLKNENFGSKWPKVTLGYPSTTTTPLETVQDLEAIKSICESFQDDWKAISSGGGAVVPVKKLSVVHYKQRSLEEIIERREYNVGTQTTGGGNGSTSTSSSQSLESPETTTTTTTTSNRNCHDPSQEEKDRVNQVLSEWDDTTSYLENVRTPPAQPYREGSPTGYCCVIFLELKDTADPIMNIIQRFRENVDEAFPGRFEWMQDSSLHCTLRAMDPKTTTKP
jgi:hypothetical protein